MTMTYERTRSLVEAEKLLREIMKDSNIPEKIRIKAEMVLRHYPTESEILYAGETEFLMRYRKDLPILSSPFLSPAKTFEDEQKFVDKMQSIKEY